MVKQFMDALKIPKFSILGWSNGGTSAMILSGKYPRNVDKLIIFGSVSYLTMHEIKVYRYARDIRNWSDDLRLPKEELYGFKYFQEKYNENVTAMNAIIKERNGDLCRSFLKDIEAETLILHGEKDLLVSKEHIPYLLKNISKSKLFTFPQGNHDIHLKYSSDFNKQVAVFLLK
jgi:valacyclovir hydrolase